MNREVADLQQGIFDVLIVGGGVYGACTAWDAVQRGLSVALIEKDDFGHATSANSLKIIHGGLRYLQDGNLALARTMVRERRAFMRIAPHLVHPLPCILPTCRKLSRSKPVLTAALAVNDLLSYDRNYDQPDPKKHLPTGQILSREQTISRVPAMADNKITGAAVWHDAQAYNTERLTLSFILSAARLGAVVVNYVKATDFLWKDRQIIGVRGKDVLAGLQIDIRARIVVNTAGPWSDELLSSVGGGSHNQTGYRPSLALNLVTRQIIPDFAVGISSNSTILDQEGNRKEETQTLFIAPWRDYSVVGTKHLPFAHSIDNYRPPERLILDFVEDVNKAFPGAALKREDVYLIHKGFLPDESDNGTTDVRLVRENKILDHSTQDMDGLITIVGVKYTLARQAAERAVDLVFKKLGRPVPDCRTAHTPLYGGKIDHLDQFIAREMKTRHSLLDADTLRHLIYNYGTAYGQVITCLDESGEWAEPVCINSHVTKAEVVHGVRNEMARKLSDIILRRTELGTAGKPSPDCVLTCAQIMAAELGWDQAQIVLEIEEVDRYYSTRTLA